MSAHRTIPAATLLLVAFALTHEAWGQTGGAPAARTAQRVPLFERYPLRLPALDESPHFDPNVRPAAFAQMESPPGAVPLPSQMGGMPPGAVAPSPMPGPAGPGYEYGPPGCADGGCETWDSGLRNMILPEDELPVRWYNVDAQVLLLTRETGVAPLPLSSIGVGGPTALDAGNFDFHEEPGIRLGWQTVIGPADAMELSYLGTFFYEDSAEATDGMNNLFSAFSDLGNDPFGGYDDLDEASLHRINYKSDLHSLELNYRYRWISPNNRIENSLLLGVRFVRLDEEFRFSGQTADGNFDYRGKTENNDLGFQLGGDMFVKVFRGISLGGEAKAGIYGNSALQKTSFAATTIVPTYEEDIHRTTVAFVSEANALALVRVNSHLTMKAGYELLFLDRVALAPNNFNPTVPGAGRVPEIHVAGEVFYHGFTGGFEWTW